MSLVIDTSGFDCELEIDVYESESELQIADDSQIESTQEQPLVQSELEDSDPPSFPPTAAALEQSNDDDDADDFKSKIWNAEMRCRGKEAIVEDLKEQLKCAKADYEESISALRKLANWGNEPVPSIGTQALISEPEETEPDEVKAVEKGSEPDESWRSNSLIELLKSAEISGMGEKKLEALSEICQTFGDFEDLRTKASLEAVHLKEVLPSGFGEKITDQIEEAYFSAIKLPFRSEQSYNQESETEQALIDEIGPDYETKPIDHETKHVDSKTINLDDL